MKADLYSLTPAMMKIADNPTDGWLDEYLRSEGLVPYKFGDFKGKTKDTAPVSVRAPASVRTVPERKEEAGVNQGLLDYLASKVEA